MMESGPRDTAQGLEHYEAAQADMTNEEFLKRYAAPGCVGLAGGSHVIDRMIRRAQRTIRPDGAASPWSHAFLFMGNRIDDQHWVLESDLEIHLRQIRLGVQENRIDKFFDAKEFPNLAILDFGLGEDQVKTVLTEGLHLLFGMTHYSLREIFGTLLAIKNSSLRMQNNVLAQDHSLYCSAMVQHCYNSIGMAFVPGVLAKNTTPEDIASTTLLHAHHVLCRQTHVRPHFPFLQDLNARMKTQVSRAVDHIKAYTWCGKNRTFTNKDVV